MYQLSADEDREISDEVIHRRIKVQNLRCLSLNSA